MPRLQPLQLVIAVAVIVSGTSGMAPKPVFPKLNGTSRPGGNTAESISQTASWQQMSPLTSPSARAEMGLVYDSDRNVFVAIGGYSGSTLLAETWEYDGTTWQQKFPLQTPGGRRRPATAYDPIRHVTVMFGGSNVGDSSFFNDTWEYDGNNWVRRTTQNAPPPRNGAGMIYDPNRGRMILFGGYRYTGQFIHYDDTWEYDGLRWTQLFPSNHPEARETPGMAYDAQLGQAILFGGGRNVGSPSFNDTWRWDGNNWTLLSPLISPPARWAHAMTYDQQRGRVIVFGGLNGSSWVLDDTWEYDGQANSWTQVVVSPSPSQRWGHGLAYDPVRNVTVLFGGVYYLGFGYGFYNDTWHHVHSEVPPQRPIVLLPGLSGSQMRTRVTAGCDDPDMQVWPPFWEATTPLYSIADRLQRLRLGNDGYASLSCGNIEASDVLYSVLGADFYETLYINLVDNHYKVTPCPYDWRRSIDGNRYTSEYQYDIPQRVDECVEVARGGNPNVQVDIVAHSMGGLVARQYILSDPQRANKVHTIVSLGTPYWGTPKVFATLRYGLTSQPVFDLLYPDLIKEIALNSPASYQILPSATFFDQVGNYFDVIEPGGTIRSYPDYTSMQGFLMGEHNALLASAAENLHLGHFDDWRNDGLATHYYAFAATGKDTVRWIVESTKQSWGGGIRQDYTFYFSKNGDGTVLTPSAELSGHSTSFAGNATVCVFNGVDHGGLAKDPYVWPWIDLALKGQLANCPSSAVIATSTLTQASISRELIVEGSARVHVYDEQGRHTGPTSSGILDEKIPLVTYESGDSRTFVALPPVSVYTITLQLTDTQPFRIKLLSLVQAETLTNAISQTILFQDIPAAVGATGTIAYNPFSDPNSYRVSVDLDGDGQFETSQPPTDILDNQESADFTPPNSLIAIQGQTDSWGFYTGLVTVTIQASDTGSGVRQIEYSLDGGRTGQTYAGPFIISAENTPLVYAQASDRAGNSEYPWTQKRLRPNSVFLPIVRK